MKIKVVFASVFLSSLSACSAGEPGSVLLYADERGMQAFSDALTGLVVTGKAAPNSDDSHHELRRNQEETRRAKFVVARPARSRAEGAR